MAGFFVPLYSQTQQQMKKFLVLFALFVIPIVAYLFLASGVNQFAKLPVVHPNSLKLSGFTTLQNLTPGLNDKITILGFLGSESSADKSLLFNLNQKIYKRFVGFQDFQMLMLIEESNRDEVESITKKLAQVAPANQWVFALGTADEISEFYRQFPDTHPLNDSNASDFVYIIDKNGMLRGRVEKNDTLVAYDASSVAEINNKMLDDVKVILAEYRLALKKYNRRNY